MTNDYPSGTTAHARRRFAAGPQRLWRAFTRPEDMATWMWGRDATNAHATADLRVGGAYSVYCDGSAEPGWPSDRWGRLGTYIDVVPERRLVYTLHWDAPVVYNQEGKVVTDEVLIVTFEQDGDGTIVSVDHIGIPDSGDANIEHGKALAHELDTLASLVEQP